MSRFQLIAGAAVLLVLSAGSGWLHATFSQSQVVNETQKAVGKRIADMPESSIGPWKLIDTSELAPVARDTLECTGSIVRNYRHEITGQEISVALVVGPYGPISVHTPDICYSSTDYELPENEDRVTVTDAAGAEHQFTGLLLKSRNADGHILRSMHAWTGDGKWSAPKLARFAFIGSPYLCKLQVAMVGDSHGAEKDGSGPWKDLNAFLKNFLPQVNGRLRSS